MSHLQDALTAARRTHAILALSAAAVIIAAAPVGTDHERALSEVQALRELRTLWLPDYCLGLARPAYEPLEQQVQEALGLRILAIRGKAECPVPRDDASLETYYSLLRGSFFVHALVPDSATLVEALAPIPSGTLVDVYVGGEDAPRVVPRFEETDSVFIDAVWSEREPGTPRRSGRLEASIGARRTRVAHPRDLVRSLEDVMATSTRAFARHGEEGITGGPSGLDPLRGAGDFATGEAIPTLRSAWTEIRDMSLNEAAAYFRAQAAEGHGGVEVFGLRIDLEVLALGGPTFLVFLLAHLLLHIRHVDRIAGDEVVTFRRFPWFALFPDGSARTMAILSIWIVPVVAGVVVTWRVMEAGPYHTVFAGGGTLLIASLGWRVLRDIARVRGRIGETDL